MLTRRDTLRVATALAASRAIPFAVTPGAAAAALDAPADFWDGALDADAIVGGNRPSVMAGPAPFAEALDGFDVDDGQFVNGAPDEWAWYKQALDVVIDLDPERLAMRVGTATNDLDEAVVAMGNAMWDAGVRAGATYEHLRLALMSDRTVCNTCNGHGRDRGWDREAAPTTPCLDCLGAGVLPAPRQPIPSEASHILTTVAK